MRHLLIWRKNASAIHDGKLMHFAPEDGTYVYFRYNDSHVAPTPFSHDPGRQSLNPDCQICDHLWHGHEHDQRLCEVKWARAPAAIAPGLARLATGGVGGRASSRDAVASLSSKGRR
jgi:hypothetical protein